MANPQIEYGYTKIANELLEAILKVNLSNYAFRVFMAILRKTYGFNKKTDWISLTQMSELTGIRTSHICRAIHELINKNMLLKNGKVKGINKNYKQWKLPNQVVPNQVVPNEVILPNQVMEITYSGNKKLPNQVVTKEKKETYTKEYIYSHTPIKEIKDLYNIICISLPKATVLTSAREKVISVRWKKYNKLNVYEELFQRAEESDFLSGRNGKWTSCNFDWLLNETNMIKVLEGNYDNRTNKI